MGVAHLTNNPLYHRLASSARSTTLRHTLVLWPRSAGLRRFGYTFVSTGGVRRCLFQTMLHIFAHIRLCPSNGYFMGPGCTPLLHTLVLWQCSAGLRRLGYTFVNIRRVRRCLFQTMLHTFAHNTLSYPFHALISFPSNQGVSWVRGGPRNYSQSMCCWAELRCARPLLVARPFPRKHARGLHLQQHPWRRRPLAVRARPAAPCTMRCIHA